MALKIWKDGVMTKIDTNLHKPVIFLNGDKYKLDKAYTFVNGQKQQIWGESGVQIDYISSTGVLGGGFPFAVGETWLNCYCNNNIYFLDISNLSNPTLTRTASWGNVIKYNNYQSDNSDTIFEGWNGTSRTDYKFTLDNSTGAMSVVSSMNFTPTSSDTNMSSYVGMTNSYFINCFSTLANFRPQFWNRNAYWNDTQKYGWNMVSLPLQGYFQDNTETIIGWAPSGGLSRFSNSGYQNIAGSIPTSTYSPKLSTGIVNLLNVAHQQLFSDGTYVYTAQNSIVQKRLISDLTTQVAYYDNVASDEKLRLLGKIGNYVYCLKIPLYSSTSTTNSGTPDSIIKLLLLNDNDFSVAYEKVLPNDPFNENYGYPNFWTYFSACAVPQISETGFLSFGYYDNTSLKLRIVRFSGLI